jgi:hypothetical protein
VWIEYDTIYHSGITQKKKDLVRQNNIIKYFESINKPLKSFIRFQCNKDGNVFETKYVYGEQNII